MKIYNSGGDPMAKWVDLVRDNWGKLLIAGIAIGVGCFLKDSKIFLGNLTDEELEDEREKVRLKYCESTDVNEATSLYNVLCSYDDEMAKRSNAEYDGDSNTDSNYRWTDANRWDRD